MWKILKTKNIKKIFFKYNMACENETDKTW